MEPKEKPGHCWPGCVTSKNRTYKTLRLIGADCDGRLTQQCEDKANQRAEVTWCAPPVSPGPRRRSYGGAPRLMEHLPRISGGARGGKAAIQPVCRKSLPPHVSRNAQNIQ
jgi:hypothetical protein